MSVVKVGLPIGVASAGFLILGLACYEPTGEQITRISPVASPANDPEIDRLIADLGEPVAGIHAPYCMPTPHSKADDAYDRLRTHGRAAVPQLISHLGDPNIYRRAHCASLLGEIGDTRAVEPLCDMVAMEVNARGWAINALGRFEDKRAVSALIALLTEGSGETLSLPAVQVSTGRQAAVALAEIGKFAVPSLEIALKSPNTDVRTNAAFALEQIRRNIKAENR